MRILCLCLVLLTLNCRHAAFAANDQPHSAVLAEARATLSEYFSSIRSISVTLETTLTAPGMEEKSYVEWCMDGDRKLLTKYLLPQDHPSGKRLLQFRSQCAGKAYSASFWLLPEFHPSDIVIKPGQPIAQNTLTSETAYRLPGFCIGIHGESLAELIQRDEAVVERFEEVHGHGCWRVNLGADRPNHPEAQEHTVFVWLDPEAGFLIRQISMTPSRIAALRDDPQALKTAGRQPGEVGYVYSVRSFQLIDDPVLGQRWFPDEQFAREGSKATFQFVSVKVNHAIPRDTFIPQPEFATRLTTIYPDGHQEDAFEGGEDGKTEFLRRLHEQNDVLGDADTRSEPTRRPLLTKADATVIAPSEEPWPLWMWLFSSFLVCGSTAVAVWTYQRRRNATIWS